MSSPMQTVGATQALLKDLEAPKSTQVPQSVSQLRPYRLQSLPKPSLDTTLLFFQRCRDSNKIGRFPRIGRSSSSPQISWKSSQLWSNTVSTPKKQDEGDNKEHYKDKSSEQEVITSIGSFMIDILSTKKRPRAAMS